MGEVIKFPGKWHGSEPLHTLEEQAAIEQAREAFGDAVRESAIKTGSLVFGPALKRQIDTDEGDWTAVPLSDIDLC